MSQAIFAERDGLLVPSGHARGPWDPGAQHGGPPAALIVRAVEALDAPGPMLLARVTIEFLSAVPLAPLEVSAEIVRPGRRLQIAEATIRAGETEVCRARAVRLRRETVEVPANAVPGPIVADVEPLAAYTMPSPLHHEVEGFGPTGMELRFTDGAFMQPGPATAWFRMRMPLVQGEEPSGAQRAIVAADFGNGIGSELEFATHVFVNTDLTMHLFREPEGEWIAVQARTEHGPDGTATAWSRLHDARGPIGIAAQSLYVSAR